jgi:acetate kinase
MDGRTGANGRPLQRGWRLGTVSMASETAGALGGLDAVVFTAGVGENAAPVRAAICDACRWLGVELDPDLNAAHGPCISRAESPAAALVVPTDENLMIARHTRAVVANR